jgi:hypothetical protein
MHAAKIIYTILAENLSISEICPGTGMEKVCGIKTIKPGYTMMRDLVRDALITITSHCPMPLLWLVLDSVEHLRTAKPPNRRSNRIRLDKGLGIL